MPNIFLKLLKYLIECHLGSTKNNEYSSRLDAVIDLVVNNFPEKITLMNQVIEQSEADFVRPFPSDPPAPSPEEHRQSKLRRFIFLRELPILIQDAEIADLIFELFLPKIAAGAIYRHRAISHLLKLSRNKPSWLTTIDRFVHQSTGYHYVPDYFGTSFHKQQDLRDLPIFSPVATKIISDNRTTLYYDRLFTIFQALTNVSFQISNLDKPVYLAEAGVYKGGTCRFIHLIATELGFNHIILHGFDTFIGHSKVDVDPKNDGPKHKPGLFGDTSLDAVRDYLADRPGITLHQGRLQETSSAVAELKFAFVHLDMDLNAPTQYGLEFFAPRLLPGGIIIVDDYGFVATCPGLKNVVAEFCARHDGFLRWELLSGQCLLVKLSS